MGGMETKFILTYVTKLLQNALCLCHAPHGDSHVLCISLYCGSYFSLVMSELQCDLIKIYTECSLITYFQLRITSEAWVVVEGKARQLP